MKEDIFKRRVLKLKKAIKEKGIDAALIVGDNSNNIRYYSGYLGWAILIVKKTGPVLIVPEMELEKAKKSGITVFSFKKGEKENLLKSVLRKTSRIGIDYTNTTIKEFKELKKAIRRKFLDISDILYNIRSIKDPVEIKSIREACKIGDEIFSKIIKNFNFETEDELAVFIKREILDRGLEPSFAPIVASAKNSSIVHHNNGGKIRKGFLLLDFGVKVNGYCSDMSRTIYIGIPEKKEITEYENLLKVQEECITLVKIGARCSIIDKHARDKLGKWFIHGLGHGVGLDIHEMPSNSPLSKDILMKDNVITIEPGIYHEGRFGIRIEDTVLVDRVGCEILTKSPKDLIIIEQKLS